MDSCPYCGSTKIGLNLENLSVCKNCGSILSDIALSSSTDSRSKDGFISQSEQTSKVIRTEIGNNSEKRKSKQSAVLNKTQKRSLNSKESNYIKINAQMKKLSSNLGISKEITIKLSNIAQNVYDKLPSSICARSVYYLIPSIIYHGKKLFSYQFALKHIIKASKQPASKIRLAINQTSSVFRQTYLTKKNIILKDAKHQIIKYCASSKQLSEFVQNRDKLRTELGVNLDLDKTENIESIAKLALKFLRSEASTFKEFDTIEQISSTCLSLTILSLKKIDGKLYPNTIIEVKADLKNDYELQDIEIIMNHIASHFSTNITELEENCLKVVQKREGHITLKSMKIILHGFSDYMFANPLTIKSIKMIKTEKMIYSILDTLKTIKPGEISTTLYKSILKLSIKNLHLYFHKFGNKHINTIAVSVISLSIDKHKLRKICSFNTREFL